MILLLYSSCSCLPDWPVTTKPRNVHGMTYSGWWRLLQYCTSCLCLSFCPSCRPLLLLLLIWRWGPINNPLRQLPCHLFLANWGQYHYPPAKTISIGLFNCRRNDSSFFFLFSLLVSKPTLLSLWIAVCTYFFITITIIIIIITGTSSCGGCTYAPSDSDDDDDDCSVAKEEDCGSACGDLSEKWFTFNCCGGQKQNSNSNSNNRGHPLWTSIMRRRNRGYIRGNPLASLWGLSEPTTQNEVLRLNWIGLSFAPRWSCVDRKQKGRRSTRRRGQRRRDGYTDNFLWAFNLPALVFVR